MIRRVILHLTGRLHEALAERLLLRAGASINYAQRLMDRADAHERRAEQILIHLEASHADS